MLGGGLTIGCVLEGYAGKEIWLEQLLREPSQYPVCVRASAGASGTIVISKFLATTFHTIFLSTALLNAAPDMGSITVIDRPYYINSRSENAIIAMPAIRP